MGLGAWVRVRGQERGTAEGAVGGGGRGEKEKFGSCAVKEEDG